MSYAPIGPEKRPLSSAKRVVLVGCGGLIAAFGLACIGIILLLVVLPEGGVKLNNELGNPEREQLSELDIPIESALAYFDRSTWQNGSDLIVVTSEKVIHFKDGRSSEAQLDQVEALRRSEDPIFGNTLELDLPQARTFKVNAPIWNGGEILMNQIERAWEVSTNP
jgi:hypothetical protein